MEHSMSTLMVIWSQMMSQISTSNMLMVQNTKLRTLSLTLVKHITVFLQEVYLEQ